MRILVGILVFLAGCGDEKKGSIEHGNKALIPSGGQTLGSSASSPSIDVHAVLSILEDVLKGKPISEPQIQMLVATGRLMIRELIAMREEFLGLIAIAQGDKALEKRLEEVGQRDIHAALNILHDVLDRKPISEEQIQMVIATTRLTEPEIRELIAIRKEVLALSARTDKAARKRSDEIGQRTIQLMNKASSL